LSNAFLTTARSAVALVALLSQVACGSERREPVAARSAELSRLGVPSASLELARVGCVGALSKPGTPARHETNGRVEYRYGSAITEWYEQSRRGIEQGFTIEHELCDSFERRSGGVRAVHVRSVERVLQDLVHDGRRLRGGQRVRRPPSLRAPRRRVEESRLGRLRLPLGRAGERQRAGLAGAVARHRGLGPRAA
jgi:hypothetical protein